MSSYVVSNKPISIFHNPFVLGSFRNWLKLLWCHGGIDRPYLGRALFILLISFCASPLRVYERVRYDRIINTLAIKESPIFIIGHWRSGTTHLHNLICQDKNLGYVSTFQAVAPELFLVGKRTIKSGVAEVLPATRVMDNVALSLDGPLEEEFGMANLSPCSFYHQWSLPKQARYFFETYTLFHNVPETVIAQWQKAFLAILRKATLDTGGKRLVTKSPTNTARVKILLNIFPDAKFIHLYRNPYDVFLSTRNLYDTFLAITQLQAISRSEIEANILLFYTQMMQKFLAEKHLIPPENLVEVKFENLDTNPLAELRRIYERLNLPGFSIAEPALRTYIATQASYQKNRYALAKADIEKVNRHWQFAFEAWGYAPLYE
jgi:hypothetical protein